jgi:hypothetical protein
MEDIVEYRTDTEDNKTAKNSVDEDLLPSFKCEPEEEEADCYLEDEERDDVP